jgi:uncharacterized protein (TIGR03086 family)
MRQRALVHLNDSRRATDRFDRAAGTLNRHAAVARFARPGDNVRGLFTDTRGALLEVKRMATTMPTTGELYVRAMESTRGYIDAVNADQWEASTPCSEWDVKQVANHIIGENLWATELFAGKTIGEVGDRLDGDLTGADPAAAYAASVAAATPVVSTAAAMEATCHLSFGDYSGSDYAAQLFMDLLVHGWDIAKATGQPARLDPDLVQACLPIAEQLTTQFRSAGVFGENLSIDAGADPQTRLLALVGRRA